VAVCFDEDKIAITRIAVRTGFSIRVSLWS
jgi:hypothetical protein